MGHLLFIRPPPRGGTVTSLELAGGPSLTAALERDRREEREREGRSYRGAAP